MNRDERSYQLSHVYHKLFTAAATSSGERKSAIVIPKKTIAVSETSKVRELDTAHYFRRGD